MELPVFAYWYAATWEIGDDNRARTDHPVLDGVKRVVVVDLCVPTRLDGVLRSITGSCLETCVRCLLR